MQCLDDTAKDAKPNQTKKNNKRERSIQCLQLDILSNRDSSKRNAKTHSSSHAITQQLLPQCRSFPLFISLGQSSLCCCASSCPSQSAAPLAASVALGCEPKGWTIALNDTCCPVLSASCEQALSSHKTGQGKQTRMQLRHLCFSRAEICRQSAQHKI